MLTGCYVGPRVSLELHALSEGFPTGAASIRPFARMGSHVGLEMGFLIEALSALRTNEHAFSCVCLDVPFNVLFSGERLATRRTREWPLSGVDPNV